MKPTSLQETKSYSVTYLNGEQRQETEIKATSESHALTVFERTYPKYEAVSCEEIWNEPSELQDYLDND